MAAGGTAFLLAATACGDNSKSAGDAGKSSEALKDLSVVVSPGGSLSAFYLAEAHGFFEKAGLKVRSTVVNAAAIGVAALIGNKTEVVLAGGTNAIQAVLQQNAKITTIGTMFSSVPMQLIVRNKVSNPSELNGLKAMVIGPVSSDHVYLDKMLTGLGADPATVKKVYTTGGTTAQVAALKSGQVDMAALSDPAASLAVENGATSISNVPDTEQVVYGGIFTTKAIADAKDPRLERFLQAISAAFDWGRENPEDAKTVIAKAFNLKPGPILDSTYKTYVADMSHPDDLTTSDKMLQGTLGLLKVAGIAIPPLDDVKQKAVDNTFATAAAKAG